MYAKKKKSIQKALLPLVHSHSVSYGQFKRRLVDFLSIEYCYKRRCDYFSIFGGLRRSTSRSSHISEGRGTKSIVLNQGLYYIKRPGAESGFWSRVEGNMSRVEGAKSRVLRK